MQLGDKETVAYIDNFFTSIPPSHELKYSSLLWGKNTQTLCRIKACSSSLWKDTKHVSFLLNAHSSRIIGMVFRKLRRGENVILTCLPYAVNFNKNMGAFHRQDQLVSDYAIDRNSRRWWARRFVHFFDAITLNAYTLFTRKISKLWAWLHRNIPLSPLNMKIYLIGNFSCRKQPGPAPAFPPTLFHANDHDSVSLVEQGLFKFGRCHHCCIVVKGA
ncbi:hypothetical protein P5673_018685 [Acropora cervicornis]|uniref:PiggyBac transposable element-derived protein domain-containing protein n=1 Tax=Acropora cervicornis TaxID=6130 RepID=A0AAD9QCU1_ACRCE|nr:hypothetical protein P5673_018685 [Acropora cervicornis]